MRRPGRGYIIDLMGVDLSQQVRVVCVMALEIYVIGSHRFDGSAR